MTQIRRHTFSLLGACAVVGAVLPTAAKVSDQERADLEAAEPPDPRYESLPQPGSAPDWAPPQAKKTTLKNGLSVWQMEHGATPLVSIHLILPVGSAADPAGKAGLTRMAADLLDEGAGDLSALELSDRLGELATDYSASSGLDYVLLSMNALAENLEPSLRLLADIVQRPHLKKEEFERRKKYHVATALADRDDPRKARNKARATALFGKGYASQPGDGTQASLSSLTFDEVTAHAKALTVPEGAHLTLAGKIDPAAQSLVEELFGGWSGAKLKVEHQVEKAPEGGTAYIVDFPGAAQSSLSVAMRAGQNGDPNYFAEEVMHHKLGGSFTGRINMNLREDKGYTYGARSAFSRFESAGYFTVSADVKSETTGASITEVFKELTDVCGKRPLTDKERNESVDGMLLGYPLDFDQVSSVGYRLASLPIRQRPVDFWTTWPKKLKEISTARANEAAKPYCDPKKYSVIVAGDKKSVEPELKKLGLKVVELGRDGQPLPAK